MLLALTLVATLFVSGCKTTDWCLTNSPWRPANEAELQAMSQDNVDKALKHNRYGQEVCGWKK